MPVIDGMEFLSRLRGHRGQDQAPTPVIALTAFPDKYDPRHAKGAGFSSYLVKPVEPDRVALEVRRVFDHTYSPLRDDDIDLSA
jgi:CheY-like chemotaxis protein